MKQRRLIRFTTLTLLAFALLYGAQWYLRDSAYGPKGKYLDSGGTWIHYTDEGAGEPVLLIHGFGNCGQWQWRDKGHVDTLAKQYRVITLDARGHGRSGKPHAPEEYGMKMVADIVRLLDHLHLEKAHVVGYSMGGFITLKFAATHPERVISAAACGAGWEQANEENLRFSESVAAALESGSGYGPLRKRLGMPDRTLTWMDRLKMKLATSYFNDARALAAVARGSRHLTLTAEELQQNKVPVLTVIGSEDGLLGEAQALTEHMKHHELVVMEGRNHMNTSATGEFLAAIMDFLAQHRHQADATLARGQHVSIGPTGMNPGQSVPLAAGVTLP